MIYDIWYISLLLLLWFNMKNFVCLLSNKNKFYLKIHSVTKDIGKRSSTSNTIF